MPRVCPRCQRESPVETEFCPACGAPMDEHVFHGQQSRAGSLGMPMKWHKFLTWVSLPLGTLMMLHTLITTISNLARFDAKLYVEALVPLVRFSLYTDLAVCAVLLPCFVWTELALLRMQWRGVRGLLLLYGLQAVYGLVQIYLFIRVGANTLIPILSLIETALLLLLSRVYYKKRRGLFS